MGLFHSDNDTVFSFSKFCFLGDIVPSMDDLSFLLRGTVLNKRTFILHSEASDLFTEIASFCLTHFVIRGSREVDLRSAAPYVITEIIR